MRAMHAMCPMQRPVEGSRQPQPRCVGSGSCNWWYSHKPAVHRRVLSLYRLHPSSSPCPSCMPAMPAEPAPASTVHKAAPGHAVTACAVPAAAASSHQVPRQLCTLWMQHTPVTHANQPHQQVLKCMLDHGSSRHPVKPSDQQGTSPSTIPSGNSPSWHCLAPVRTKVPPVSCQAGGSEFGPYFAPALLHCCQGGCTLAPWQHNSLCPVVGVLPSGRLHAFTRGVCTTPHPHGAS
jgi:hypothetical protein